MYPKFLNRLHTVTAAHSFFELTVALLYRTSDGYLVRVPVGFLTDLASIPWFFRWLFHVNGDHRESSALHDRFYFLQGRMAGRKWSRWRCDWEYQLAMESQHVAAWRRYGMFIGVALFGWWRWYRCGDKLRGWVKKWLH